MLRPECYKVFVSSSEVTCAKQRDKFFEQVEKPRTGHNEWSRKGCYTMSETETGLDDGDRDQMMLTGHVWWMQGPGDGGKGVICGIWYSIYLLHFMWWDVMEHKLGMGALWPVHVAWPVHVVRTNHSKGKVEPERLVRRPLHEPN